MGIENKTPEQLEELQYTLEVSPWIKEVHFTENGTHYFQKHKLKDKYYGFLRTKAEQKVVLRDGAELKVTKHNPVDTPEAEIKKTMTRDEVLDFEPEKLKGAVKRSGRRAKAEKEAEAV